MKRLIVVLVVAMSLALVTAPASAKPKPPEPAEMAAVTLTPVDASDGLAGELQMGVDASRKGDVAYFADGNDGSSAADLVLRGFDGVLAQGLHHGLAILDPNDCGEPPRYEGIFWLKIDKNGVLTDVMWHFDMDVSYTAGRKGCAWRVNKRYTIRALSDRELLPGEEPLTYAGGVVSGTFNLHLYDADASEPHVNLGHTFMQFGLAIDQ
jgi:hypothetical protein